MSGPGHVGTSWRWLNASFVVLMLALTALFVGLGVWQLQRLQEKEALIAAVENRVHAAPVPLPAANEWQKTDWEPFNYRPLTVTGHFEHAGTVLVFTSLAVGKGHYSGPGYWVMTPFALDGGGALFVNRGFVPQDSEPAFASGGAGPAGTLTLIGIGRLSEATGSFTPEADRARRIDWVRNIDRLALLVDPALRPFAPISLDLPAGKPGVLPQGGGTEVEFPNNHLGYAFTWFGFALITPVLLAFWIRRQRRTRDLP